MCKEKFLRIFYNALCFVGAGFWMMRYLLDYVENEDVSSISFESFDQTSDHGYPTFSICLTDRNQTVDVLNPDVLNAKYHPSKIAIDFYSQDVNGYELNTWTTSEFLKYAGPSIKVRNQNISSVVGKTEFPFFLSYQDYQRICFTKKKSLSPSSNMRYDQITLNMNKFEVNNDEGTPLGAETCEQDVKMYQNSDRNKENDSLERNLRNKPGAASFDRGTNGRHSGNNTVKLFFGSSYEGSFNSIKNDQYVTTTETIRGSGEKLENNKTFDESDMKISRKDTQKEHKYPNRQPNKSEKRERVSSRKGNETRLKISLDDKDRERNVDNRPIMREPNDHSKPGGTRRITRALLSTKRHGKGHNNEQMKSYNIKRATRNAPSPGMRPNSPPEDRRPSSTPNAEGPNMDRDVSGVINAQLYVHDQGYLLQGINHEHAEYQIKNIKFEDSNKLISTRIQQVTRLQKRPDARKECDPLIENDDIHYMNVVTNQVNCIPWYWKSIVQHENGLTNCSSTQLKIVQSFVTNRKNVPFFYKPSCTSTTVLAVTDSMIAKMGFCGEDFWAFRIFYPSEMFTQIVNTREVDQESLWSGIGGFFGMFLGFSLMQIPDLLVSNFFCQCDKK